ncbi:hypothetical protein [Amycolatopsis sp. CA-230715]|uniref:hypothetical protein n=1 Tax=Amycolatopsis sp. CA-230715 TaxID=2745196 RepID=UPI001C027FC4|nr:hypothetical protein [Amycolatopsis sp. CA-230715]QWF81150.1 hypothetical protein HUW46_04576 [Amycolatopsis sp. CA-230715]
MSTPPPPPLAWHSTYREQTWLLEWLADGRSDQVVVPHLSGGDVSDPEHTITMTKLRKMRAIGLAPYVGPPFVYEWMCAVDEHGHGIAGEARRVYTEPIPPHDWMLPPWTA